MKSKYLSLTVILCLLFGCSSNSLKDINIVLPKNSVGVDRPELARDMLSSVDLFIQRNLKCSNWSLENITESKAEGQLVFTSDGQIYRGKVSEEWKLQQCGKKLSLKLEIAPNFQGGSLIRIKSLSL